MCSRQLRPARSGLRGAQIIVICYGDSHQCKASSTLIPSAAHYLRREGAGAAASPAAPREKLEMVEMIVQPGTPPGQGHLSCPSLSASPKPRTVNRPPPPAREMAACFGRKRILWAGAAFLKDALKKMEILKREVVQDSKVLKSQKK